MFFYTRSIFSCITSHASLFFIGIFTKEFLLRNLNHLFRNVHSCHRSHLAFHIIRNQHPRTTSHIQNLHSCNHTCCIKNCRNLVFFSNLRCIPARCNLIKKCNDIRFINGFSRQHISNGFYPLRFHKINGHFLASIRWISWSATDWTIIHQDSLRKEFITFWATKHHICFSNCQFRSLAYCPDCSLIKIFFHNFKGIS